MRDDALEPMLGGDVLTGRGIDEILPHPVGSELYEDHLCDARDHVTLAEQEHGPISRPLRLRRMRLERATDADVA